MRLNHGEAHDLRAVKEHRAAAAGRWQAVSFPSAAALDCLIAGCGRTGAVGGTHRVARSASAPRHGSQQLLQRWRGGSDGCTGVRACTRDHGQHGSTCAGAGRPVRCAQDAGPSAPCSGRRGEHRRKSQRGQGEDQAKVAWRRQAGAIGGGSTASFRCWRIFRISAREVAACLQAAAEEAPPVRHRPRSRRPSCQLAPARRRPGALLPPLQPATGAVIRCSTPLP